MRFTLCCTPLLLLGACANLIVGEEDPQVFTSTTGNYSAETDVTPEFDLDDPEAIAPQPEVVTEAWRIKRGQVLRTFAFRALERGLLEEARGYLQEACQLDATDVESHCALARLYLAEGDARAATVYAERAATANPDNPGARLVYAATLAETGEAERADRQVEIAWDRSGHDPALARAMVTHFAADESGGAAQTFVKQVLAEHPRDPRSWTAAGDLFLAQGQVDEAATAYAEAMSLDPSVATPHVLESYLGKEMSDLDPVMAAAVQAERNGDLAGAERLYRFLSASPKGSTDTRAGLARVLWRRGRLEAAQTTLDGIDMEQRTWREHLLEAKISFKREDWEGARGSLLLVLELRPELRAAELLLGDVERHLSGEPLMTEAEGDELAEAAEGTELESESTTESEELEAAKTAETAETEAAEDETETVDTTAGEEQPATEGTVTEGEAETATTEGLEAEETGEAGAEAATTVEETEPVDPIFGNPPATQENGEPWQAWTAVPAPGSEPATEPATTEPATQTGTEAGTETGTVTPQSTPETGTENGSSNANTGTRGN